MKKIALYSILVCGLFSLFSFKQNNIETKIMHETRKGYYSILDMTGTITFKNIKYKITSVSEIDEDTEMITIIGKNSVDEITIMIFLNSRLSTSNRKVQISNVESGNTYLVVYINSEIENYSKKGECYIHTNKSIQCWSSMEEGLFYLNISCNW